MKSLVHPKSRALSPAQLGIWIAQNLDPQSAIYNIAEYIEIKAELDDDALLDALRAVALASDALHLRVVATPEGPRQFVARGRVCPLRYLDLAAVPDAPARALEWMRRDYQQAVDLRHGPLFALAVLRLGPEHYWIYARSHHICNDGFGGALFIQQVADAYSARMAGAGADFDATGSWFDLLDQEQEYRSSARYAKDRDYWLERMRDATPAHTLSGRPPGQPGAVVEASAWFARREAEALQQWGAQLGVSLSQLLIAGAALYLNRLTGRRDIVLGIPVLARTGAKSRSIIGMMANVLPLRLDLGAHQTLAALALQVMRASRELMRHQRYSREDLRQAQALGPEDPEQYGMVVNVNAFSYDARFAGHPSVAHNLGSRPVNDLQLVFFDNLDGADIRVKLFGKAAHYTVVEVETHLRRMLALLGEWRAHSADERSDRLALVSAPERQALLYGHNQTTRPVASATLVSLF